MLTQAQIWEGALGKPGTRRSSTTLPPGSLIFAYLPKWLEQRPMGARALFKIQLHSLMSSSLHSTNETSSLLFDKEQD
jgi:hypothetical protein